MSGQAAGLRWLETVVAAGDWEDADGVPVSAGVGAVVKAARAMRALEAMLRWEDDTANYVKRIHLPAAAAGFDFKVYQRRGGREYIYGAPTLPAAILAAHAALVAAGEIAALDGEERQS